MITFPNIKINLGLYITGKREDGFHNLISCFYPVNWCDILEIVPASAFEFIQTGIQIPGSIEDNLCVKAFNLLRDRHSIPNVRIHLHKIIPMGAGLGGGSADASFTLKCLNDIFHLGLEIHVLESYAGELGSDCAFFIKNEAAIASSRGEILEKFDINLKGKYILIICPEIHVSTKQAFANIKPEIYSSNFKQILINRTNWRENLANQFEDSIFPLHPTLSEIKNQFYNNGAFYASMSGSGSAIFGLFDKEPNFTLDNYTSYKAIL